MTRRIKIRAHQSYEICSFLFFTFADMSVGGDMAQCCRDGWTSIGSRRKGKKGREGGRKGRREGRGRGKERKEGGREWKGRGKGEGKGRGKERKERGGVGKGWKGTFRMK